MYFNISTDRSDFRQKLQYAFLVFLGLASMGSSGYLFVRWLQDRGGADHCRDCLTVVIENIPNSLDPRYATDALGQKISELMHRSLVKLSPTLQILPDIAESWSQKNYTEFSFKIKKGLQFQDQTPIHAIDVKQALLYYIQSSGIIAARNLLLGIQKMEVLASDVLWIQMKKPSPFFLNDLTGIMIFKKIGENNVVGAGDFIKLEENRGYIVLERFKKRENHFNRIKFLVSMDDTTRFQLLERGDADVAINGLSLSKTDYLKSKQKYDFMDSKGINVSYLLFNYKDRYLSQLKIRQAIAQAIDIDYIIKYRFKDYVYRSKNLLSPLVAIASDFDQKLAYEYDAKKSEKILDEAGYKRNSKTGWRFSLNYKVSTDKTGQDIARLISFYLKKIGIDVRIEVREIGMFFSEVKAGNFQICSSRWIGITTPEIYYHTLHTKNEATNEGMLNRGSYSNRDLDVLLKQAIVEPDDEKRQRLFSKVEKLIKIELPYLPLWHWNNTFIGKKGMKNIIMYPNGSFRTLTDLVL